MLPFSIRPRQLTSHCNKLRWSSTSTKRSYTGGLLLMHYSHPSEFNVPSNAALMPEHHQQQLNVDNHYPRFSNSPDLGAISFLAAQSVMAGSVVSEMVDIPASHFGGSADYLDEPFHPETFAENPMLQSDLLDPDVVDFVNSTSQNQASSPGIGDEMFDISSLEDGLATSNVGEPTRLPPGPQPHVGENPQSTGLTNFGTVEDEEIKKPRQP
jgi:hypothetical protein